MKFMLCMLIACVLSASLTLIFGLGSLEAFLLGMVLGFISQAIAQIWEDY